MLTLDRYFGFHFFTNDMGGSPMLYVNLIWTWGHPEVYILVLPAFGIYSEVVSTFSRKTLFGYKSMVYATIAITVLAFQRSLVKRCSVTNQWCMQQLRSQYLRS